MAYQWLSIGASHRVEGMSSAAIPAQFLDSQRLMISFVTEVIIVGREEYVVRVDSFALLYELIEVTSSFPIESLFEVHFGEGWWLRARPSEGGFEVRFEFDVPQRKDIVAIKHLSAAGTLALLCLNIAELVASLEEIGVDIETCFSTHPPKLWARNGS